MKKSPSFMTILGMVLTVAFPLQAQTYINETFETDTIGAAPSDSAQFNAVQTLTAAGTGVIGTDNVARFNDTSAATGGDLEYNVGASAVGNMYIKFDLMNNAPNNTGTAANSFIFGVGSWSTLAGTRLSSNARRAFNVEFSQTGATNTFRLRVDATAVLTTTYNMFALQNIEIFVNDHDTNTLNYLRPDGLGTGMLGANSFVVYLNGALIGAETAAGFAMNTISADHGNTTGDLTIGRLGFNTASTTLSDFLIDNLYVSDVSAVPEPSTVALLTGAGLFLFLRLRRKALLI